MTIVAGGVGDDTFFNMTLGETLRFTGPRYFPESRFEAAGQRHVTGAVAIRAHLWLTFAMSYQAYYPTPP